jgi:RNA polymerase sigma-70 factor, ECF subfamily
VQQSWESVVRDYAPKVIAVAWRILGHTADAEDVAQEVFLEAYRKFSVRADFEWTGIFHRLTVCRALDRRRKRKPGELIEPTKIASPVPGPAQAAAARELIDVLRYAVDNLPRREAEVFCLRYFEDLSPAQIANALSMKPGAVATALSKARTKLQERLRPVLSEGQP